MNEVVGKYCYKLWLSYNPKYINPLTGRPGQYRVVKYQNYGFIKRKDFFVTSLVFPCQPRVIMYSSKKIPRGLIVNPTKILKELLDESTMVKRKCNNLIWSEC